MNQLAWIIPSVLSVAALGGIVVQNRHITALEARVAAPQEAPDDTSAELATLTARVAQLERQRAVRVVFMGLLDGAAVLGAASVTPTLTNGVEVIQGNLPAVARKRAVQTGPLSITRLTTDAEMTRQAVTKHLEVLADAGVVRDARRGRERLWQLEPARLADARARLERISAQWDGALDRLRTHLER